MSLLNPWLLSALAALAIPILVHLVQRDNSQLQRFPSLMFLQRIPFPLKRRRTLRDRGLLLLRCLALTLLVLGFSAPYCSREQAALPSTEVSEDVVFLLDGSYSMSHERRWASALKQLQQQIDALDSGQRAGLIVFNDSARILTDLTTDHALLRAAFASLSAGHGGTRFAAGLGAAGRLLTDGGSTQARIVLISDLQGNGLNDTDTITLPDGMSLDMVTIDDAIGPNLAVIRAELLPVEDPSVVERVLAVQVQNTGDAAVNQGFLYFDVDGRRMQQREITLAPDEQQRIELPLTLALARPVPVQIEVGPDELAADNRHYLVLAGERQLQVALLETDRPRPQQSLFLQQALRLASSRIKLQILKVGQLTPDALSTVDVLISDDSALPSGADAELLQRFVGNGGGLWVIAGEDIGTTWPKANEDYLPGKLGLPQTAGANPSGIDVNRNEHPLITAAGLFDGTAFAGVRVATYRSLQPDNRDTVVLQLDNGAPLLVERSFGRGRSLVLTTTADPRWSTLALEPGFVPLVHATIDYLAARKPPISAFTLGETVDLDYYAAALPGATQWQANRASARSMIIESPNGDEHRLGEEQGLYTPSTAGLFTVHSSGIALPFAVNGPRSESVLRPLEENAIRERVQHGPNPLRNKRGPNETADEHHEPATYLLLFAGIILVLEGLLANRISARRHRRRNAAATV